MDTVGKSFKDYKKQKEVEMDQDEDDEQEQVRSPLKKS